MRTPTNPYGKRSPLFVNRTGRRSTHSFGTEGTRGADAQDLVQGFLAHLLEHNRLCRADQEEGTAANVLDRVVAKLFAQTASTRARDTTLPG